MSETEKKKGRNDNANNGNRYREYEQFSQTNAFAMQYGLWLGLYFIITFGFYISGMLMPGASLIYIAMLLYIPILTTRFAIRFRNKVCDGVISFGRAYVFTILQYVYAALIHVIAVYVFFAFFENGMILRFYETAFANPQVMEQMNRIMPMNNSEQLISLIKMMTPTTYAAGFLTWNVMMGSVLSIITALIARKGK